MFIDMRSHPDHEIQKSFQEDARVLCASLYSGLASIGIEFVELNVAKGFTISIGLQVLNLWRFSETQFIGYISIIA